MGAAKELYVLHNGFLSLDKSLLTMGHDMGNLMKIPILSYLVKTDEGNLLFDTGFSPTILAELAVMTIEVGAEISEEDSIVNRLGEIGLQPQDVHKVILSHLHIDHVGGLQYFPHAEVIVQKDEYAYAFYPHSFSQQAYVKPDFDFPDFNWKLLDGDQIILPGVAAILTNGHTPGHQSLLVELPQSGTIVLAGDSCDLMENIEEEVIPGIVWDSTLALYSIKRLKTLAEITGGKVFPNHDLQFWQEKMVKAPRSYP